MGGSVRQADADEGDGGGGGGAMGCDRRREGCPLGVTAAGDEGHTLFQAALPVIQLHPGGGGGGGGVCLCGGRAWRMGGTKGQGQGWWKVKCRGRGEVQLRLVGGGGRGGEGGLYWVLKCSDGGVGVEMHEGCRQ